MPHRDLALLIRDAEAADVPAIVALYADDPLGREREEAVDPLPAAYWHAAWRPDAHGVYEALGFRPTHVGTKLLLDPAGD